MSDRNLDVIVTDDRRYPQGVPCWVDVTAADPEAAARFYAGLFGWELTNALPPDAPGAYLVATLDGHDVAAVASAPSEGPDAESGWRTYIACDDADATAAAVSDAGGRVLVGPQDAGPGGRDVTCADPAGALFHLWQARRRLGAQLVNKPGSWNFSDLHTARLEDVLPFYHSVLGWEVDADQGAGMIRLPGYGEHLRSTVDPHIHERQSFTPPGFADVVAGVSTGEDRPGWQVRFGVADRDESVATAERLGATVVSSVDTPWTREALIRDPQGALLTVSQFTPPE